MGKLTPLHAGEQGPPFLVNGLIVTRAYSPRWRRHWKVYTMSQWKDHRVAVSLYHCRTKADAVHFARNW